MTDGLLEETAEEKQYFDNSGEVEAEEPAEVEAEEPEAEAEAEAEPKPADDEEEDKVQATVPYSALHKERARRKELQARVDEQERRFAEKIRELEQRVQKPEVKVPDLQADPVVNLDSRVKSVEQAAEEIRRAKAEQEQRQAAQQQQNAIISRYREEAEDFKSEHADFDEAYQWLIEQRSNELEALGHTDREQRMMFMASQEFDIVQVALRQGVNPAERLYEVAKRRGFKPKPKADKIATLEKGQKAARSIGAAGGATAKASSLEALLSMSDSEFDKATSGNKWQKLFS